MKITAAVTLPENEKTEEFIKSLSFFIIEKYENILIRKITQVQYSYSSKEEIKKISDRATENARQKDGEILSTIHYNRRRMLIEEALRHFFEKNRSVNIEGFINFRLEDYKNELKNLCHDAAEELYAMREYDEFLSMLSFFISVQSPKETVVHIVKRGGTLRLLNKRLRDITDKYSEEALFEDESFSTEDVVLSALITIAPRKIVIHDVRDAMRIYETIISVFPDVEFKDE